MVKRALYAMRLTDANAARVNALPPWPKRTPWKTAIGRSWDIWIRCGHSRTDPEKIRRFITWG